MVPSIAGFNMFICERSILFIWSSDIGPHVVSEISLFPFLAPSSLLALWYFWAQSLFYSFLHSWGMEIPLRLLRWWLPGLTVLPPLSAPWALLGPWLLVRTNIKFHHLFSLWKKIFYDLKPPYSLDPTFSNIFFFHAKNSLQPSKRIGFWRLELRKFINFTLTQ